MWKITLNCFSLFSSFYFFFACNCASISLLLCFENIIPLIHTLKKLLGNYSFTIYIQIAWGEILYMKIEQVFLDFQRSVGWNWVIPASTQHENASKLNRSSKCTWGNSFCSGLSHAFLPIKMIDCMFNKFFNCERRYILWNNKSLGYVFIIL